MPIIHNFTATSTASDVLTEGHNVGTFVIRADSGDLIYNIGADADATHGETVAEGTSATVTCSLGKRVSVYAASSTNGTLREEL